MSDTKENRVVPELWIEEGRISYPPPPFAAGRPRIIRTILLILWAALSVFIGLCCFEIYRSDLSADARVDIKIPVAD
jgi:hypothetical protein